MNTGNIPLTANDLVTKQTGTFTLSNVGGDGSTATWSATSDSGWLTMSPSSGSNLGTGNPQTITVTADPKIAGSGTHTGTITIGGTSLPTGALFHPPTTVTVTFDVTAPPPCQGLNDPTNGCPAAPTNCSLTPNPANIVIPQKSTLTYHCENVTSCFLSGGEIPSPIAITPAGTTADGKYPASPTTNPSVYTLSCQGEATSSANYSWTTSVQVNVATSGRTETAP